MIQVQGLEKAFGDRQVLRGLSFTAHPGEIYGLLGPNGAGKTTTINLLCNLLEPDAGSIRILEREASAEVRQFLGIAPQEISVYRDLTCRENLEFFAAVYGLRRSDRRRRADELIDLFQLQEYADTPVSQLSGGWQRRINIAVSLVHNPPVLILDEPTAGLDVEARYELWELIENLRRSGMTLLLTIHYLQEAERLCSRIGILLQGRIIAEGTLEELRRHIPAEQLAAIACEEESLVLERVRELGWTVRHYGGRLTLWLPRRMRLKELVELLDGLPITSITLQEVALEHIYLELSREEENAEMR